jgi:hypothetical protein
VIDELEVLLQFGQFGGHVGTRGDSIRARRSCSSPGPADTS